MRELIACAPAVTVNAAVCAPAVYVHAVKTVLVMKNPFRFNEMHIRSRIPLVESGIYAVLCHELVMRSALLDPVFGKDKDTLGIPDR